MENPVNDSNIIEKLDMMRETERDIYQYFRQNKCWKAIVEHIGKNGSNNVLVDLPEDMVVPIRRGLGYDVDFQEVMTKVPGVDVENIWIKMTVGYHHKKDRDDYPDVAYKEHYLSVPRKLITNYTIQGFHDFIRVHAEAKPDRQQREDMQKLRRIYQRHRYLGVLNMLNKLVEEEGGTND